MSGGIAARKPMVEAIGIVNRFGAQVVHDHLDMTVVENEVFGIVGGSGTPARVLALVPGNASEVD